MNHVLSAFLTSLKYPSLVETEDECHVGSRSVKDSTEDYSDSNGKCRVLCMNLKTDPVSSLGFT